jgi:polynucleotide 5'-hydroxyl-kinase GRC3/NOL9
VVLKLPDGERLVILGSYGIRLQAGTATIAGASLRPSDTIHWVHAPHCHALPVLRCSDDTVVELLPHPATENLRRLERLSPLFRSLWNDKEGKRSSTFKIVSPPAREGLGSNSLTSR